jgi:PAS domain S-box-containing protein
VTRAWQALIVAVLGLLLTSSAAGCSRERAADDGQRQRHVARINPSDGLDWIYEGFKFHAGDDARWASPDFDDRAWEVADTRLERGPIVEGWEGIGWFRAWIDVPPESTMHPVPIYGRFVGATEVFVDGTRAFAVGDPGAVAATGVTPIDLELAADAPRWVTFSGAGRHLLAVRFASQGVAALHRVGFPAGFELAVAPRPVTSRLAPSPARQLSTAFVAAAGAFALLHLLLYFFHRDRRANLYYALSAIGVASITLFDGAILWGRTPGQLVLIYGAVGASVALSMVLLLRFYHEVFSLPLTRSFWVFFVAGCTGAALSWVTPRAVAYTFASIVAFAQARVLVGAMIRRTSGSWILGVGGTLWLVSGMLQMGGDVGVGPRLPGAYLYGFLAVLGSMSVYIARDIAHDKASLARKLVEVGELSARQREAMERYRTVFETTGTGMILFADDAVITLANDEWVQITGYSREEIEGKMPWMAFFSERSLEKMRAYHKLRSRDPSSAPRTYEAQLRDRRGRLHEGVVTISMVPGTKERVGSFLDMTDLKRAQRQMVRADKMAALGQIIAGVAHEINNPNNFIHFNLPILRRYVDAMRPILELEAEKDPNLELLGLRYEAFIEDLFKLIDNMEHGSARITAIVLDLKNYIRSGEDLEMKEGSIAKVVEQVMVLVGKQVRKTVKRFDVEVAETLPSVRMNAGKIEQVIINLLINAGQAADKEASWVKLVVRATDAGHAVELRVEDNGAGIPADSLEQIFEPFFTTKGRETGTGLGLAISQQIVEEHGGTLEVTSEVGAGSTFTVRLPAAA